MREDVTISEKLIVTSSVFCFIVLAIFIKISSTNTHPYTAQDRFIAAEQEKIILIMQGAVKKPGAYKFLPGVSLKDVVKKVALSRYADLDGIDWDASLTSSATIRIPSLSCLQITVAGAVETEGLVELPLESKVVDIKKKVRFQKNADLSVLKSRRYIKNKEHFIIPFKEKKKK